MRRISFLTVLLAFSQVLFGQWSSDPEENLDIFPEFEILGSSGGFTVNGCSDGSVYFTAYSMDTTLLITLVNTNGFKVWRDSNIAVKHSKFYNFSSFTDHEDNLYLAFKRSYAGPNGFDWVILKINKQGQFCWGDQGISIAFPNQWKNSTPSKWAINRSGDVFLLSQQFDGKDLFCTIHRIGKDGDFKWTPNGLVLEGLDFPHQYDCRNLIPTLDGGVLVVTKNNIGLGHDDFSYEVFVRKYNCKGTRMWVKDPMIYSGWTGLNGIITYPDGQDGFFFSSASSIIQHVDKNGSLVWVGEGASLEGVKYWSPRPKILGRNATNDLLLQYQDFGQDFSRDLKPFIQVVDESGEFLFPEGVAVPIPEYQDYDFDYSSIFRTQLIGDSVYYFYSFPIKEWGSVENEIMCYPTTFDQRPIWKKSLILAQGMESRASIISTKFVEGQSVVAWLSIYKDGSAKIKAQNMHSDGSLGNKSSQDQLVHKDEGLQIVYDPSTRRIQIPVTYSFWNYQIISLTGNVIQSGIIQTEIDLPIVSKGMFLLRVWDGRKSKSQMLYFE